MISRPPLPSRAAFLAIGGLLLLAACRGAGAGSPSAATSAEAGGPAVAVAESSDVGAHLVDAEGRTLYVFTNDSPGETTCTGDCATSWPPATVEAGAQPAGGDGVTGAISTIERADGTLQLTVEGWPLYRYAADQAAGDTTGEGVGGVWFVARPDGTLPGAADGSAEPSADGSVGDDNPDDYY